MDKWDKAALQALVAASEEERQDLEFKAADAMAKSDGKKVEITRDVSSMANAAGGTIIFGIAEDNHHATAIDPIDPREYPKEWLDQVIHGIEPRIPDVSIQPVEIEGQRPGVVYVMIIPQSVTAHQARDDRYYRRYNFERLRMRHHEIVDVLNRAKVPNLELEIGYETKHREYARHDYVLTLKVVNHAMVTAAHYKVEITVPHPYLCARADSIHADWPHNTLAIRGLLGRREEEDSVTIVYRSQRPLYPEDVDDITNEVTLRYSVDNRAHSIIEQSDPDVTWAIYADNAVPKTGRMRLKDLQQL